MWLAVDFTADKKTKAPFADDTVKTVVRRMKDLGVLASAIGTRLGDGAAADLGTRASRSGGAGRGRGGAGGHEGAWPRLDVDLQRREGRLPMTRHLDPAGTVSAGDLALQAFCDYYGVDAAQLPSGKHAVSVLNPHSTGFVEAVAISGPFGRFGNNLRQLINAANLAIGIGTRTVLFTRLPHFEAPVPVQACGLRFVSYDKPESIVAPALCGRFLTTTGLSPLLTRRAAMTPALIKQALVPLCTLPIRQTPRGPHEIAFHMRAGDVFRTDRPPHEGYPQPPLAYYIGVLNHFRAEYPNPVATIVFEDLGNPCIEAFDRHLEREAVPRRLQSASFREDMAVLFAHRTLVFGRGSSGRAIVALSSNVERVYSTWMEPQMLTAANASDAQVFEFVERTPIATPVGQWANTEEQRALMLSYPLDNLDMRVLGKAGSGPPAPSKTYPSSRRDIR